MATQTNRLGLVKQERTEKVNLAALNNNLDKIDNGTTKIWIGLTKPAEMKTGDLFFKKL